MRSAVSLSDSSVAPQEMQIKAKNDFIVAGRAALKRKPPDVMSGGFNPNVWSDTSVLRLRSSRLLLARFFRLVLQVFCFLEQRLLFGRVLLEVRRKAEEQALVGHRVGVIRFDAERFIDGNDTFVDVVLLLVVLQPRILAGFVLIVDGDHLPRFGVVGFFGGALFEGVDRLGELALAVVEGGERGVHRSEETR